MKVHLDTDLGGDIDDLCALAMLLRWQGVQIIGITTVAEAEGKRAGYVRYSLNLEGKDDIKSAKHVLENSNPTLIPLTVSVETALRRAYLKDLENAGKLGQLLARQAKEFAIDENMESKFGENCEGLPNDIINFQHDSLACAIAIGWNEGIEISEIPLKLSVKDDLLHEEVDGSGKMTKVVTKINGNRFNEFWIETIANQSAIPKSA